MIQSDQQYFFSKGLGGEKPPTRGASKELFFCCSQKKKGMSNDTWEKSYPAIGEDLICVSFQLAVAWDFFLELTGRSYKYKGWKMMCSFRAMPGMSGVQGCLLLVILSTPLKLNGWNIIPWRFGR